MSRIDLLLEDWGLLLTPRFAGLGAPGQQVALALLVLLPVLLILWLYRYELRLVRRLTAAVLLALRLVLVALLWFVVCWQPILARTEVEEVPSRVVIAVDFSGSMNITDPQRSREEKLLLAHALKLKADKDGQDLEEQLCAEVDKLTRAQIVQKILSPDGMDLLRRLEKNHQVEIIGFDQTAWQVKDKSLKPVSAAGEKFTDLGQPLAQALEAAGNSKGKAIGLLLFTDGRHNTGDDPEAKAREFKARGLPIFPIAIGGKKPPPDIAVVKVTAPANLLQKTPAQLSAEIKVLNLPAQDLIVELHQAGEAKPKEQILKHKGGEKKTYTVDFPLQPDKLGTQQFTVKVRPASPNVKEITEENNSLSAVVRVVEDKARVLLVDNEARWEFHYLANALARDEAMKLDQVLLNPPYIGAIAKPLLKDAGHPALQLPLWDKDNKEPDPLLGYHCIILGDVPPERLPPAERARLAKFVAERGGTLVLLAGKQALPLAYLDAPGAKEPDALAKMLPVTAPHVIKPADGFSVTLTPDGDKAPYLQLEENPAESAKTWAKLPRHYWAVIGKAKPGATVLAYVKDEQTGLPALAKKDEPQRNNTLIAVQNYGLGRVVYVGLDSTWRWRYSKGDLYHHRFWGQLILWAASDQFLPAGNKYVHYGTKQPVYKNDEDVEIVVRLEEAAPLLSAKAKVQARVILENDKGKETIAVVPLHAEAGSRLYKGVAKNLPAGKFRIELDIPELADKLKDAFPPVPKQEFGNENDRPPLVPKLLFGNGGPDASDQRDGFVVLPTESKEMAELSVNWLLLDNLARQSGGGPGALTPDRLDDLLKTLNTQVVAREQREERRPWQDAPLTWYLLGGFVMLLTVEWTVRKMAALP